MVLQALKERFQTRMAKNKGALDFEVASDLRAIGGIDSKYTEKACDIFAKNDDLTDIAYMGYTQREAAQRFFKLIPEQKYEKGEYVRSLGYFTDHACRIVSHWPDMAATGYEKLVEFIYKNKLNEKVDENSFGKYYYELALKQIAKREQAKEEALQNIAKHKTSTVAKDETAKTASQKATPSKTAPNITRSSGMDSK